MTISDIMTSGVIRAEAACPLDDVISKMYANRISCVVVCHDDIAVGIITERDLARARHDQPTSGTICHTAEDLMSSPLITLKADASIEEAAEQIERLTIRHFPVVDHVGKLAGIVTQTDLLRAHTQQLKEIVNERTRELSEAIEQLKESDSAKGMFLANMSHELRTPMTAILGFADFLIEEGDLSSAPASRLDYLHTIKRNGKHLLRIVDDILDMSKIDAGKLDVERVYVSPIEIVSDVRDLLRQSAIDKGLGLEVSYDGRIPKKIQSDPTRLRQILTNIIGNAIKFTTRGGVRLEVKLVGADSETPHIQFAVTDTGCGMSPKALTTIFDAFSQADASVTRQHGGTGLGLSISKHLAELLGGDLKAESIEGSGSTFTVTVGTGSLEDVPLIEPTSEDLTTGTDLDSLSTLAYLRRVKAQGRGARVLLVEDGPDNRRLIKAILERVGFTVGLAENGLQGVEMALAACDNHEPFDVILMDIQMPVLDGYEATEKLRVEGYAGSIIALTAHAMTEDRERCLTAGCDDYVCKPVRRRELVDAILKYLPDPESR
jgi:signal transduction histidine kinase/ActR/RegA family two-component response regulator